MRAKRKEGCNGKLIKGITEQGLQALVEEEHRNPGTGRWGAEAGMWGLTSRATVLASAQTCSWPHPPYLAQRCAAHYTPCCSTVGCAPLHLRSPYCPATKRLGGSGGSSPALQQESHFAKLAPTTHQTLQLLLCMRTRATPWQSPVSLPTPIGILIVCCPERQTRPKIKNQDRSWSQSTTGRALALLEVDLD